MALQFSTSVRNAMLDSIENTTGTTAVVKIFAGTIPLAAANTDSGSVLVTYPLASDWAGNAATGSKAFSSTPLSANATATGTAAFFRLYASDGVTCHMQGTATVSGGGGDMTLDNVSINSGQNVQITSWTLTAPGA